MHQIRSQQFRKQPQLISMPVKRVASHISICSNYLVAYDRTKSTSPDHHYNGSKFAREYRYVASCLTNVHSRMMPKTTTSTNRLKQQLTLRGSSLVFMNYS